MPKKTKKAKSLLSNLQKANEARRHSKASKFDLSLQETQEIPVNTDFSLFFLKKIPQLLIYLFLHLNYLIMMK